MDWIRSMQNAINYIEDNLLEEIDYDEVAKSAHSSTYHFQKLFHMMTGFTLGEYIRNRRLTLAAQELSLSDMKITDIAFKYGYSTSEAFTKAFYRMHKITPSAAKEEGASLKSFSPLSIQITLKGDKAMNYKIEEKEAFKMFGKDFKTTVIEGKCYKEIPEFWEQCTLDGTIEKIVKLSGKTHNSLIDAGILFNHNPSDGTMNYMIGCEMGDVEIKEEFKLLEIPSLTWAIFEVNGNLDSDIHDTWKRIASEWFPTSNYEHADAPEMERYFGNEEEGYRCEIWIPVIKKI